jgi:hypothetical protein
MGRITEFAVLFEVDFWECGPLNPGWIGRELSALQLKLLVQPLDDLRVFI